MRGKSRTARWTFGSLMATVAIMASACGSSSSSAGSSSSSSSPGPGSGNSAPPSPSSPPHGETIKIGYICSCTGALASSISVNLQGYEAWVKATNANGGINGHQVQLFVKDDALNPATSVSEVHELIGQDHVIALVETSNVISGWDSYVNQEKIPVIGSDGADEEMYTNPDFFFPGQTDDSLPLSVVLGAKKVGATKLATFFCAEATACSVLEGPTKTAAAQNGVKISYSTVISASAPSFAAQCLAAKQSGATALFVADAVSVNETVAKDCHQQGYNPTVIVSDGAVAESFKSSPGLSNNLLSMQPQIPFTVTNTPGTIAMINAFKKYEPSLMGNPNYNGEVVEAWTSGLLFAAAAKAGDLGANGNLTSQQLYNGLYALNGSTLGGMAPPLNYKPGVAHTVDCWFWLRTSNGQFTTPYGVTPQCASPSA